MGMCWGCWAAWHVFMSTAEWRETILDCFLAASAHAPAPLTPARAHTPQVLSTRARKDVAIGDIKVQVCVFPFDCLYINGRPLLSEPLTERRKALYGALEEREGELMFATYKTSRDTEELAVSCAEGALLLACAAGV